MKVVSETNHEKGIYVSKDTLEKFEINDDKIKYEIDGDRNFIILRILREEDKKMEEINEKIKLFEKLNGLLADEDEEKVKIFDETIKKRVSFSGKDIDL